MIIKNQDIQVNLMIFLSQLKTYKNLFPKQRKSQINNFTIARQTVFLEKVIKSINFQTNIKSPGIDSLTTNFINTFQMNYLLSFILYQ